MTFEPEYRPFAAPPTGRETGMGGIGAGVLAGSLMLLVLIANSIGHRHVWWMMPNVLGSTFYGSRGLRAGAGFVTLAGVALHLLISGLIGGVFAWVTLKVLKTRRLFLFALFVTMLWYFLAYQLIWAKVNPFVPLYASEPSTAAAHLVFAITMSRSLRAFLPKHPQPVVQIPPALPLPEAGGDLEAHVTEHEKRTAPEGPVQLE